MLCRYLIWNSSIISSRVFISVSHKFSIDLQIYPSIELWLATKLLHNSSSTPKHRNHCQNNSHGNRCALYVIGMPTHPPSPQHKRRNQNKQVVYYDVKARDAMPGLEPPNRHVNRSRRKWCLFLRNSLYVGRFFKFIAVVKGRGVSAFTPSAAVECSFEDMWMNRWYWCLRWLWCIIVVQVARFWQILATSNNNVTGNALKLMNCQWILPEHVIDMCWKINLRHLTYENVNFIGTCTYLNEIAVTELPEREPSSPSASHSSILSLQLWKNVAVWLIDRDWDHM